MKIKNIFWIFALNACVYWLQDFEGLPGLSLFKHFKEDLHWSPEKLMMISSLLALAWIPKILWGFFVDNYLSKRTWIAITLIIDMLTVLFLGLWSLPLVVLLTLIFFNNTESAIRDVTADAIMCIEGKRHNLTGKIQSCQWTSLTVCSIVTSLLGGYIADHYSYQIGFLLIIPFYLLCVVPLLMYKEVKPETCEQKCGNCEHNDVCDLSKYNVCSDYKEYRENTSFIEKLKPYKQLFTNKTFLWIGVFILLYNFSPGFGVPLQYIERDQFKWSFQFMGMLGAICSVASIMGYLIYGKISEHINIRKWIIGSVFLGATTTLAYLYFTPVSAIVYGIVFSIVGAFLQLIMLDFMARKTIKGLEATTFACLCGITNLGGMLSNFAGAGLLHIVGLKWLIIVSAITSFACLTIVRKIK